MRKIFNLLTEILESHLKLLTIEIQNATEDKYLRTYYADIGKQLELIASQHPVDCEELLVGAEYIAKFMGRYRSLDLLKKKMEDERWMNPK